MSRQLGSLLKAWKQNAGWRWKASTFAKWFSPPIQIRLQVEGLSGQLLRRLQGVLSRVGHFFSSGSRVIPGPGLVKDRGGQPASF